MVKCQLYIFHKIKKFLLANGVQPLWLPILQAQLSLPPSGQGRWLPNQGQGCRCRMSLVHQGQQLPLPEGEQGLPIPIHCKHKKLLSIVTIFRTTENVSNFNNF
jgi:hypothetical protein